jgi:predicted short-subunit dehydrogenase-like oxidoreductase (DUF2520 family)
VTETEEGIGIIGAGRLGRAIGARLSQRGHSPRLVHSRSESSAAGLAKAIGASCAATSAEVVRGCGVTLLTVPDGEVAEVAAEIARELAGSPKLTSRVVAHCAGVHGTEVLRPCALAGAAVGVIHPLAPVPDGDPSCLEGAYASVEGDPEAVRGLELLAGWIGLRSFELAGANRVLYHAAAVLAGVLPVLLEELAERLACQAGAGPDSARGLRQLLSLTGSNVVRLGPRAALSGASVRRDRGTTASHLGALGEVDPRLAELYRSIFELAGAVPERQAGPKGGPDG